MASHALKSPVSCASVLCFSRFQTVSADLRSPDSSTIPANVLVNHSQRLSFVHLLDRSIVFATFPFLSAIDSSRLHFTYNCPLNSPFGFGSRNRTTKEQPAFRVIKSSTVYCLGRPWTMLVSSSTSGLLDMSAWEFTAQRNSNQKRQGFIGGILVSSSDQFVMVTSTSSPASPLTIIIWRAHSLQPSPICSAPPTQATGN